MYLIQSEKVKGDQNVGKFKECFKVVSIDYESGRSTIQAKMNSNTRTFGGLTYSPIRITKEICKASVALQDNCSFGVPSDVKIYCVDSNNTEYLEIALKNAAFSNYQFKAHGGMPTETFDISYTAITVRHTPRNEKGLPGTPVSTGFNLSELKR